MTFAEIIASPEDGAGSETIEPRKRFRIWRVFAWLLAALLVLLLGFAGWGTWSVMRAFPQTNGEVSVSGLQAQVKVQRDALGIPTITAETSDDLFFTQGYVHAQDRFWEMDFRRHLTSGRLSELFGEAQLGTDVFLRTLNWHGIAEQEVAALPDETRGYYEAYAEGVNAYLAERSGGALGLSYTVLSLQNPDYEPEPWTPADSVAWLKAMAWDLRTNIEDETDRALIGPGLTEQGQLAGLYPGYPEDHPVILAEDPAGEKVPTSPARSKDAGDQDADAGRAPEPDEAETVETAGLESDSVAHLTEKGSETFTTGLSGSVIEQVDAMISSQGEGVGSNSWVVAGEHTRTGRPLLANDPHLGAELPSVWTQMQLRCATVTDDCPFTVAGFSFAGLPGIVIGHNTDVAWGFTNLTTDVADLFIERVEDDGYWLDDEKLPFETRNETIKVAGGDDVEIEVRSTGHGPIVSGLTPAFTEIAANPAVEVVRGWNSSAVSVDESYLAKDMPPGEYAVSLQWTALSPGSTAEAIFMLNTANDFEEFRDAAAHFDVPAQNLIYADIKGNIGYQAPGRLPIRSAANGWLPTPGWLSEYDWDGFIPFDELPTAYNPESGYIVTANNAIVNDDYPYLLSQDWDYGYRAARIVELLEAKLDDGRVSASDMTEIQLDNQFPAAALLQHLYAGIESDTEQLKQALTLLAEWDGQNDADSAAAAFANVLWEHLTAAAFTDDGTPLPRSDQSRLTWVLEQLSEAHDSEHGLHFGYDWLGEDRDGLLLEAAEQAHAELVSLQGSRPDRWNWGELHALPLTNASFGKSGIAPIEALFNRGPVATGGGSGVVNATGWTLGQGYATETVPSLRMVIDLSDWDASTWQNLTGQSGHPFNTHYTDQSARWASGKPFRWRFTQGAVHEGTRETLRLTPQQ